MLGKLMKQTKYNYYFHFKKGIAKPLFVGRICQNLWVILVFLFDLKCHNNKRQFIGIMCYKMAAIMYVF